MSDQTKYSTKLVNARILIIGGSSGIGYGIAEACVEHGALVTISSSNSSRVQNAVNKIKSAYPSKASNISGQIVDLGKPGTLEQELDQLFNQTTKEMPGGKLDHVIFTAGDALSTLPVSEMTMEKIVQAGQIRFFAPLLVAKYIEQHVEKSRRSSYTITTGSISERAMPNWSVIGSYAGGHHSMVRNVALDLKPIRVNGVSPGAVDTEMWRMGEEEKKEFFKGLEAGFLTGSVGSVEDVVESYLGVLRDGNVNGSVVRSDGGVLAH